LLDSRRRDAPRKTVTTHPTSPAQPPPDAPAPLLRRLAALAYDALLLLALLFAFTLLVILVRGGREIDPGTFWFEGSIVVIALVFCAGFWTRGGQTLGMRAWRIRVVAVDGGPVTWPRAAARFFAGWLAALPAGLGYWWAWIDRERRCWHDRLSGTRVIRVPPRTASGRD
jgi:uncharacterized RDD family membrane protein YckC